MKGEQQARELHAGSQRVTFTQALTSPLRRARRTAELAGFASSAQLDDDLRELDCGDYEGRRTGEIRAERPGLRLLQDDCPHGESLGGIATRADRVIARIRDRGGNALAFAHRDILRIITVRWMGLDALEGRRLFLDTATIGILGYQRDLEGPVVCAWNLPHPP